MYRTEAELKKLLSRTVVKRYYYLQHTIGGPCEYVEGRAASMFPLRVASSELQEHFRVAPRCQLEHYNRRDANGATWHKITYNLR